MTAPEPPLIVLGNRAADLDSTVCTLTTAWLLSRRGPMEAVPLLRGSREDLRLKPEIPALFSYAGIRSGDLVYEDSARGRALLQQDSPRFFLVDHNAPEGIGDSPAVSGIIDHHQDSGFQPELSPRILGSCGSCASLVSREWFRSGLVPDRTTALLLGAAILVDTGNFHPAWGKATDLDTGEYGRLRPLFTPEDGNFLQTLPAVKQDLSSLSAGDLLRRDYKEIPCSGGLRSGISSIPLGQEEFFRSPSFHDSLIPSFCRAKKLDLLFLMHTLQDPFGRQLSCFAAADAPADDEVMRRLSEELQSLPSLGLAPVRPEGHSSFRGLFFRQEAAQASRKVVLPLLQKVLFHLS